MSRFKSSVDRIKKKKESGRKSKTLYLHEESFEVFQEMCEKSGLSASELIDDWIEEAIRDERKKR